MDKQHTLNQVLDPGINPEVFFILAGPCAIEGEQMAMDIAGSIHEISVRLNLPFIFKGSYRKANRTSLSSFTGIGDLKALEILQKVGKEFNVPVVTDIHESHEAEMAAEYVDVLQIPAFLFRQTDLLVAAAKTNKVVNIKKGQFAAANAMKFAMQKVLDSGNSKVLLTDRGNMYGYNDLIVDMRNIPEMKSMGAPVIMDITHSLQQPNQGSGVTGGKPELIETIAKAAIAVGADGLFVETHPDPANAKSDGANMLNLNALEPLLNKLLKIKKAL
ncbi:MAG: 3-deoxy-8-phosphooctulonate synthase [Flavobacteriales bacterium]|nr:3-deoxy-8-phosphooctulonate synthase [Flavobacteriales bacterium]